MWFKFPIISSTYKHSENPHDLDTRQCSNPKSNNDPFCEIHITKIRLKIIKKYDWNDARESRYYRLIYDDRGNSGSVRNFRKDAIRKRNYAFIQLAAASFEKETVVLRIGRGMCSKLNGAVKIAPPNPPRSFSNPFKMLLFFSSRPLY